MEQELRKFIRFTDFEQNPFDINTKDHKEFQRKEDIRLTNIAMHRKRLYEKSNHYLTHHDDHVREMARFIVANWNDNVNAG